MIAEILSTGDEVLTGAVIDSNAAHIAEALSKEGIAVSRQSCVGDDVAHLVSILQEISNRAEVAVVTGGLGPTPDDLTAEVMAKAAGVQLVYSDMANQSIEAYFKARKRPRNPSDKKQAMLPEGADCLMNPVGTAPGFVKKINNCRIFCIPGVPSEMRVMLSDSVLPYIKKLQGENPEISLTKTLSLFGLPESRVGEDLKELPEAFPGIRLGLRAKFPEIHVKLYARGKEKKEMADKMDKAAEWVLSRIGRWVFSTTEQTMASEIGSLLIDRQETLAVAESCTGGLIANWLTDVPGSSGFFHFSGVTYANQAKIDVLGVSQDTLNRYGAVHENTVKEMAQGARKVAGTTFGLATSGIAGPDGGTDDKPVGTLCIGLSSLGDLQAHRIQLSFNDRLRNKSIFATTALEILRRKLLGIDNRF